MLVRTFIARFMGFRGLLYHDAALWHKRRWAEDRREGKDRMVQVLRERLAANPVSW